MKLKWRDDTLYAGVTDWCSTNEMVKVGQITNLPNDQAVATSPFTSETFITSVENEASLKVWVESAFSEFIRKTGLVPKADEPLPKGRNEVTMQVDTELKYRAGEIVLARVFLLEEPSMKNSDNFVGMSAKDITKNSFSSNRNSFKLAFDDIVGRVDEALPYAAGDHVYDRSGTEWEVLEFYQEDYVIVKKVKYESYGMEPQIKPKFDLYKRPSDIKAESE